jgi:cellulose synthase/poly-beta-1,6-N-acetylglucosamine synthase-like glycosyltransferase
VGEGEHFTTVVIPAYAAWETLPAVLDALEPQARRGDREVIVVESSGDGAEARLARWPWVRLVALPERTLPGRARNLAAEVARGDRLAFLDADAVPARDWLDALEAALGPDVDAVAGAVVNGTPRSPVGTAGYLLEFADWLPRRRGPILHAATCNLLVRREALERAGGFAEDVWPGEDTILTFGLAAEGRLAFEPAARVRHLNRTRLGEFLRHQRRLGRAFAHVCARVDFPHRALGRPRAAPLAGPFRLGALAIRLAPQPREAAAALALLPVLAAGVAAWAVGLAGARL